MDLTKTGVYSITNTVNGKQYIGSAGRNFRHRWNGHKTDLRKNKHHCQPLQRAWNKYGEEAFKFEVLFTCPKEYCIKLEQWFLNSINPEYNICKIAGNSLGVKRSQEQKDRHRKFMKELYSCPNRKEEFRQRTLKQFSDPEAIEKARQNSIKQFSDPSQREKQSKLALERYSNPDLIEKIRQRSLAQYSDPTQIEKSRDGHSKFIYEIQTPSGEIETTISIKKYADDRGLKHTGLYNTLRGYNSRGILARHHKGYKVLYKTPRQK